MSGKCDISILGYDSALVIGRPIPCRMNDWRAIGELLGCHANWDLGGTLTLADLEATAEDGSANGGGVQPHTMQVVRALASAKVRSATRLFSATAVVL